MKSNSNFKKMNNRDLKNVDYFLRMFALTIIGTFNYKHIYALDTFKT